MFYKLLVDISELFNIDYQVISNDSSDIIIDKLISSARRNQVSKSSPKDIKQNLKRLTPHCAYAIYIDNTITHYVIRESDEEKTIVIGYIDGKVEVYHSLLNILLNNFTYEFRVIRVGTPVVNKIENFPDSDLLDHEKYTQLKFENENKLLNSISIGDYNQAIMYHNMLRRTINPDLEPVDTTNLRFLHTLNTLSRKAVEKTKVPFQLLDTLSSRFSNTIDNISSSSEAESLSKKIIEEYSTLAKDFSLAGLSEITKMVKVYIDSNYSTNASLNAIASIAHVDQTHISKTFKKEMGLTVTQYLTKKRMYRSTYLLKNTDLSISHISSLCGYDDSNYFSRSFKNFFHTTPSEYRKLIKVNR